MQREPALRLLLAATLTSGCGTVVLDDPDEGNGGNDATTASSVGPSGPAATTTSGTAPTGSGTGMVVPLACAPEENVLVTARASGSAQGARIGPDGTWQPFWYDGPLASAILPYVDPYHRFGILLDGSEGNTRVFYEAEPGLMVDSGSQFQANAPLIAPANVGSEYGPIVTQSVAWQLSHYDPDAQAWSASQQFSARGVPSGMVVDPTTARITVVTRDFDQVCTLDTGSDGVFGGTTCLAGVTSPQSEIPITPPQIVALPDGTQVIVYGPQAGGAVAAVVRHGDAWSPPVIATSDAIGVTFAAATSVAGDVVVGVLSTGGDLSFLRYAEASGWSAPVLLGSGYDHATLGASPGACGADAFLGASRGGSSVDVARVYGMTGAVDTALPFPDDFAHEIRFAVRRPFGRASLALSACRARRRARAADRNRPRASRRGGCC